MDQLFTLTWGNHKDTLLTLFSKLFSDEKLVDVTLVAEGKKIEGHKLVLSACSSYFEEVFSQCPDKHPIVFLKDIKFTELQSILQFMYNGEVSVAHENLSSLITAADSLKVRGLAGGNEVASNCTDNKIVPCTEENFFNISNSNEVKPNLDDNNPVNMESFNSVVNPDSCCSVQLVTCNNDCEPCVKLDMDITPHEDPFSSLQQNLQSLSNIQPYSVNTELPRSDSSFQYDNVKEPSPSAPENSRPFDSGNTSLKDNFNNATNSGVDPKSWTCDTCGKSFEKWCQLYHHRNLECAAKSKVPCPLCLRQFNKADRMLYHLKRIHGKVPSE